MRGSRADPRRRCRRLALTAALAALGAVGSAAASVPSVRPAVPWVTNGSLEASLATHATAPARTGVHRLVRDESVPSLRARFAQDVVGNGLAVLVLVGMVAVVIAVLARVPARRGGGPPGLAFPTLAIVGAAISAYLTYVAATGTAAVCGPVGDCEAVQQSPYAALFGIPIGALGLAAYGLVAVLWVVGRGATGLPASLARAALVFITLWGTLFSIYLTYLEPFVIGATCLWCLTSAVIMTTLLWLAAGWHGAAAPD